MVSRRRAFQAGLAVSAILHAFLAFVAITALKLTLPERVETEPLSVDIVIERPPEKPASENPLPPLPPSPLPGAEELLRSPPSLPQPPPDAQSPEPSPQATEPSGDGMIRPNRMLSAQVLADPKNARAAAALKTISPADQVEQTCNLEAMEQLAAADPERRPDYVAAYVFASDHLEKGTLNAPGAAFRARGKWFELSYICTAEGSPPVVRQFAYKTGAEIPVSEWEEHNLTLADPSDGD